MELPRFGGRLSAFQVFLVSMGMVVMLMTPVVVGLIAVFRER
jgi:hypothetical protein